MWVCGVVATALGLLTREEGAESPWCSSEQPRTSCQVGVSLHPLTVTVPENPCGSSDEELPTPGLGDGVGTLAQELWVQA